MCKYKTSVSCNTSLRELSTVASVLVVFGVTAPALYQYNQMVDHVVFVTVARYPLYTLKTQTI